MDFTPLIINNLLLALGMTFVLWVVSVFKKDASIVDPFWGFGFVVIVWATLYQVYWTGSAADTKCPVEVPIRAWLLTGAVTAWGMRLSIYLTIRNLGHEEDRRYQAMREKRGDKFWWQSLFVVFWLQAVIMWFVALTLQSGIFHSQLSGGLDWVVGLGLAVWAVGFFFETVGDYQMARFKANPDNRGKVMDGGLWGLTRHPNYFGDFSVWWGHFLIAATAQSWWTVGSPALMSFFLMKVSGVTLLESDIEERRPAYAKYRREVSAFFPRPRKRNKGA